MAPFPLVLPDASLSGGCCVEYKQNPDDWLRHVWYVENDHTPCKQWWADRYMCVACVADLTEDLYLDGYQDITNIGGWQCTSACAQRTAAV
jgi:hypothetical protein